MKVDSVSLESTGFYGGILSDYIKRSGAFREEGFWPHFANEHALAEYKEYRKSTYAPNQRAALVAALIAQYQGIDISDAVKINIDALKESSTFTVTCGHQLCLFGGPAYVMLKIVSTINLAETLSEKLKPKGERVVPIYWMAADDHDVEEISKFRLYWQEYIWETTQKGPTGSLLTHDLTSLVEGKPGESLLAYSEAYKTSDTLSKATRKAINALFGEAGLLVLDPSDPALKACFADIMAQELTHSPTEALVRSQTEKMSAAGYSPQIEPRPVNLFYQGKGFRERIIKENSIYKTSEGRLLGELSEVLSELKFNPERFSPNVCLRPLYQQVLLPDLGVLLGPAELHYWMQLKEVFAHFNQKPPVLVPRAFSTFIPPPLHKKIEKLGFEAKDWFSDPVALRDTWLAKNAENPIPNGDELLADINAILQTIQQAAADLEPGLGQWAGAESAAIKQKAETVLARIEKTWRKQHDDSLQLLQTVRDKILPLGKLQERKESLFTFIPAEPNAMIELIKVCNPLDLDHKIIYT